MAGNAPSPPLDWNPSHDELNLIGVRWLRRQRCGIVLSEIVTQACMTPDVIGWRFGRDCFLIESKRSVSDLRSDKDKPHHRFNRTPGHLRWYLTTPGLVKDPLTLPAAWGLLEALPGGGVREVKKAPRVESCVEVERMIMASALRRWQSGSHRWDISAARFRRHT